MCKNTNFGSCVQVWPYRFDDLIQSFGAYYLEGIIVTYFHAENTSRKINKHCYNGDYDTQIFLVFLICRHLGLTSGSEVSHGIIMEVPLCSIFKSNETKSNMHIYIYNDPDSTLIFKAQFFRLCWPYCSSNIM